MYVVACKVYFLCSLQLCGCAQVSTGHTRVSSLVERWETGPGLADVFCDAVVLPDPQDDCHWFPVLGLTCIGFLIMMYHDVMV